MFRRTFGCGYAAPGSLWPKKSVQSVKLVLSEVEWIRGVKIGNISISFQSKTLIPQNKNQIFQRFLTYFPKTSYERRATRNGYIFVSKVQVAIIIEGVFFYSLSLPPVCAYLLFCRGLLFSPPAKRSQTLNLS